MGLNGILNLLSDYESRVNLARHLGIKTAKPCFHFLQAGLTFHNLNLIFFFVLALIALQTVYTLFNFNMLQIRIYATFILIAGVIAPVNALPMPSPPQAGSSKDGSHPIANPPSP